MRQPLRFKERDVTRAAKAVIAAGLTIEKVEISKDGIDLGGALAGRGRRRGRDKQKRVRPAQSQEDSPVSHSDEVKEWLAICRAAALRIDAKTAEVVWRHGYVVELLTGSTTFQRKSSV